MKPLPLLSLVSRLEDAVRLDPWVARTKSVVDAVIRPQQLRDVLHGVPIGHPVHPMSVQIPLGAGHSPRPCWMLCPEMTVLRLYWSEWVWSAPCPPQSPA